MPLQLELDSLDGVDESVKTLYTEKDGKFRLEVDGLPDVDGLKKKVDELLSEKKTAAQKAKDAQEELEREKRKKAMESGDTETLRKSYDEKIALLKTDSETKLTQLESQIATLTAGADAVKLAGSLAIKTKGSDGKEYSTMDVLLPHIKSRLSIETQNGMPKTVVLDREGKPSALTLDDLQKEFQNDPRFAPLILGSAANGAGHQGNGGGGGSGDVDLMKLKPVERMIAARAAQK